LSPHLKILLTGRMGQVGFELERALRSLGEVTATDRGTLNLADADAVRRVLREAKPDLVVNAAAYTAVDRAESEPELATQVNSVAPGVLAEEARRLGALLVHYSTDYVFDGAKLSPYAECDQPNPLNVYGRTKLEGERRIRAAGCRCLILRTSWVYGPRGRNFLRTIAAKAATDGMLRVVADQRGVPTPSAFIAERTIDLLRRDAGDTLHLVPGGDTTWHGFAVEILKQLGSRAEVQAISTSEFPAPARRPPYSVLDNRAVSALLGGRLPDWRELLPTIIARL
jgi:dTDP-4-dehydrorhamnose reductase